MGGRRNADGVRSPARRCWCIPPAMLHDPGERLDGERILEESPGDFGLLLWRTSRDVVLWATTPQKWRADLFAGGTADARLALVTAVELPAKLAAPVDTLHAMLATPRRADPEIVMLCCLEVAAWLRGAALPHTAVAFAQAGAAAAPESGEAALFVGVCARGAGQTGRADTWLRRAVAVARRERGWSAYSSALVELGELNEGWGKLLRAERLYRLAMRTARRHGERGARMRAAYGLFRLARQNGDDASAAQFALRAQSSLDADGAGIADLLLDLARFWTDVGEVGRARGALRRLVPALLTMDPAGQLGALALTARARAEPRHPHAGAVAWRAAWVLLGNKELPDAVRYAAAIDLAHAAREGGDLRAFRAARRAVLVLAPQAEYPAVADRMAKLWPEGETRRMDGGFPRGSPTEPRAGADQPIAGAGP
jgi:hypothetical protein